MVLTFVSAPSPECATTFTRNQGIDLGSGESTWPEALPVTSLPSCSFHVGPAKCFPMTLPFASFSSASGPLRLQANLFSVPGWQV